MKVLVTGRKGQVVTSLRERSAATGLILRDIGRPELDLEIAGAAAQVIQREAPDVVINAAAYTAVDGAEDEPDLAHRINAEAAGEIAAAARGVGARLIHLSTDYVFPGGTNALLREGAQTQPLGVYGRSKLAGEELVRAAHPDHVIVRTSWVYSPFGRNFVKTMMMLAETKPELTVVADQWGNPSSALDIADGLLKVLQAWTGGSNRGLGETYHLVGTGNASWFELASFVMEECARLGAPTAAVKPIATADWPTRAARPRYSMLDSSKFAGDFSFQMPHWRSSTAAVVRRLATS